MTSGHPSLPGLLAPDAAGAAVADTDAAWPVSATTTAYRSGYLGVEVDTIVAPDGQEHERVVVRPHGAVGVLALDEDDRVLLVEQYRHPVGARMLELPAGTLDVAGEPPQEAAARELAEEADVMAATWDVLLSPVAATPGYSSERWHLYRASGLQPVPEAERTVREAEEADMQQWWVPFGAAVDAVLDGRVSDAMTVAGILAELARRRRS